MLRLPAFAIGGWGLMVTCVLMSGCFDATRSKECVSTGDSKVCLAVDGGLINVSANGLEPGSTIHFFTPEFGPDEIPVSPRGDLDGQYGFQSDSFRFEGVITVSATAADGTTLTGDVTFD
jgi:hypothetical protein